MIGLSAINKNFDYIKPYKYGAPVLSNFRIEDANKDRVYFDSLISVKSMTKNGFIISGKNISGITIDLDGLSGYFTVSEPFTFWDNNTIRLENYDGKNVVFNFTLTYIENNIDEPTSTGTTYYVDISATGGTQDGLSEVNAFTGLTEAVSAVSAGSTVWVKVGTYIGANIYYGQGTINNPIKFIGYKNTIGDITSNYFRYSPNFILDESEMPILETTGGGLILLKL